MKKVVERRNEGRSPRTSGSPFAGVIDVVQRQVLTLPVSAIARVLGHFCEMSHVLLNVFTSLEVAWDHVAGDDSSPFFNKGITSY